MIINRGGYAILTEAGVTVRMKSEESNTFLKRKKGTHKIAYWGDDNLYPQKLYKSLRKNGAGRRGMSFRAKTHYGNGYFTYKLDPEAAANGKESFIPVILDNYPEIQDFFKRNRIERFLKEAITDIEWWSFFFPEFIVSKDFKKINRVKRIPASACRYEEANEKTGNIEHVYVSGQWNENPSLDDTTKVTKVKLIDPYWTMKEIREYIKKHKIHKFIIPFGIAPVVDEYYPTADWHSVYLNGWIDVANEIPKLKKNLFKNQISVRWHIKIPENYWKAKYADHWDDWTDKERDKKRKETLNDLESALTGTENYAKAIQTFFQTDDQGKPLPGIEFEALDDKMKDGTFLPDSSSANSEILFAQGVDPSLIGAGIPGGKLGAGSGSDKREAFLILNALFKSDRDVTLEPIEFIHEYNGWPSEVKHGFKNIVLTTLDKNPTGTETQTPG